jgi:hypothetical protein
MTSLSVQFFVGSPVLKTLNLSDHSRLSFFLETHSINTLIPIDNRGLYG